MSGTGSLFAARFRKRPVEIEAVRLTAENYDAVRDWLGDSFARVAVMNGGPSAIRIRTLEGVMQANRGDWIVKGVAGEFYPVKPDIFAQTYERVTWGDDA